MSIAQRRAFGLSSSLKGLINICPKVDLSEDLGMLITEVAERIFCMSNLHLIDFIKFDYINL